MKRLAWHGIGILIGTAMVVSNFNSPPTRQTGNEAFDQGSQLGGWVVVAMGVTIIVYNVVRLLKKSDLKTD